MIDASARRSEYSSTGRVAGPSLAAAGAIRLIHLPMKSPADSGF